MQKESFALIQLKKNIEDMRPSKKPFPERNWHYMTNIGHNFRLDHSQERYSPKTNNASPPFKQLQESLTHKELGALRRQLELKDVQLKELQQKLASHTRQPRGALTPVPSRGSPVWKGQTHTTVRNSSAEKLFQVPTRPVQFALNPPTLPNRVYFTKKAPKPLSVDTITGLPRASGSSPLQHAGASVTKTFQRPQFN